MRKVFFSFDWDDVWRVNQVRNSWVTKGSYTDAGFVDSADIEKLKIATDAQIKNWIDGEMKGTSVTCVLIGRQTHKSRWVEYEIQKSIDKRNGLVGIYIRDVKDRPDSTNEKGENPFKKPPFNFTPSNGKLTYPCCNYYDWVEDTGHNNLGDWIEKAAKQAGR